jgi:hypothetical protein
MVYSELDLAALRELIEGSGLAFRQNSVSWILSCPRCNSQDKLYVRKRDGRFVCWKCKGDGYEGRPEFALADVLLRPIKEVRAKLYGIGDLPAVTFLDVDGKLQDYWGDDALDDEEVTVVPKRSYWPLDYYEMDHEFGARGREYLAGRGVDLAMATRYGLRYCPPERRVIFPVTHDGALVGWQKRAVFETQFFDEEEEKIIEIPKILSSKGLSGIRENCVMFADRLTGSKHAIICEGPIDAMKCDLAGGNVATMGKAMSDGQIDVVKRSGVQRIYLALDPDAAGELRRLTRAFIDYDVRQLLPAEGFKDLGEMTPEAVYALFLVAPRIHAGQVFVNLQDRRAWS